MLIPMKTLFLSAFVQHHTAFRASAYLSVDLCVSLSASLFISFSLFFCHSLFISPPPSVSLSPPPTPPCLSPHSFQLDSGCLLSVGGK